MAVAFGRPRKEVEKTVEGFFKEFSRPGRKFEGFKGVKEAGLTDAYVKLIARSKEKMPETTRVNWHQDHWVRRPASENPTRNGIRRNLV